ncbi:hypothetical protein L1987_01662 [Smallanthus sonchifolius]|uniref:Uncharacterized protein n=1 Tax=Smallanthus sonchifolius TaxID=185202 RepID=A0ACB9K5T9_9ASTR|nr:hypothetical protein L1987_01662 [Smallanthus sonchifolius]
MPEANKATDVMPSIFDRSSSTPSIADTSTSHTLSSPSLTFIHFLSSFVVSDLIMVAVYDNDVQITNNPPSDGQVQTPSTQWSNIDRYLIKIDKKALDAIRMALPTKLLHSVKSYDNAKDL